MDVPISADAMQILDSLKIIPVWVDPDHLVHSARLLMEGHGLPAIAVVNRSGRPVGVLRLERVHEISGNTKVSQAMEPVADTVDSARSLRDAADAMIRTQRTFLPMMRGGEFRGIVTAFDLLDGLRRSYDPMTDLAWSDELRRWGAERMAGGQEIAVIFIDLDGFGSFNRRFGHVVGDRVLKKVAAFLRERIDRQRDILVRYGGDEFAIGTIRDRAEAEALAAALLADNDGPDGLSESGEVIRFSIGVDGGKRQIIRDDAHFQATLDDLINLASKRSIANKRSDREAAAGTEQAVVAADPTPQAAESSAASASSAPSAAPEAVAADPEAMPAPEAEASQSSAAVAEAPAEAAVSESTVAEEPAAEKEAPPATEEFEVVEVRAEADPNSIAHVTLRHAGTIAVGVGMRLGRTFEEAIAYATARAVERAEPGLGVEVVAAGRDGDEYYVEAKVTREGETESRTGRSSADDPAQAVAQATLISLR